MDSSKIKIPFELLNHIQRVDAITLDYNRRHLQYINIWINLCHDSIWYLREKFRVSQPSNFQNKRTKHEITFSKSMAVVWSIWILCAVIQFWKLVSALFSWSSQKRAGIFIHSSFFTTLMFSLMLFDILRTSLCVPLNHEFRTTKKAICFITYLNLYPHQNFVSWHYSSH